MARHRNQHHLAIHRPLSTSSSASDITLQTVFEPCAPYLVPTSGPAVTLEWEPDPECVGLDEAEEVWRQIEAKMGRRLRGNSLRERGSWVVKPALRQADERAMARQPSDFSVSAYLGFGIGNDEEGEAVAIFDMAAPLVTSVSSSAATPWNTPCLRRETLHRTSRVLRKKSVDDDTPRQPSSPPPMYRLDSHVISALEALQGLDNSPALDGALGLVDRSALCLSPPMEAGLGLGMLLRSDSVYGLAMLSPRPERAKQERSPLLDADAEMVRVTDLDTGVVRDVLMGGWEVVDLGSRD